jgi:tetratricopeptide (TPR) repeat protein
MQICWRALSRHSASSTISFWPRTACSNSISRPSCSHERLRRSGARRASSMDGRITSEVAARAVQNSRARRLDAYREAGDKVGVYRALSQLVRLYFAGLGQREDAQEVWAARQQIDDQNIPLRTRIFAAICVGTTPRYQQAGGGWSDLMAVATEHGYDTFAAVCRVNLTDEFLIADRFEECVKAAQTFIDAGETRSRARAHILSNQAEALMRLGRFDDAIEAARTSINSYPDALYLLAETLAMGAIKRGRLRDAAILIGYNRAVRRERSQLADPAEAKMGAENDVALRDGPPAAELERLLAAGAAMSSGELFALAIGSGQ